MRGSFRASPPIASRRSSRNVASCRNVVPTNRIEDGMTAVTAESTRNRTGRSFALAGFALGLVLGLGGCAGGAAMTDMWNDATFSARPVQNVFVIALRKDPARRRLWEDAFVNE